MSDVVRIHRALLDTIGPAGLAALVDDPTPQEQAALERRLTPTGRLIEQALSGTSEIRDRQAYDALLVIANGGTL